MRTIKTVVQVAHVMRKPINFLLSVMLMTGIAPGQGSEFWHKKEYRQWSEKECNKLLDDSPWAKKYTLSRIYIDPLQRDTGDRERVSNPEIKYVVQLRSARPIRQALVRQSQIAQNYDKLPADQQQQFDTKAEEFLSARFPDTVIVYVSYTTNVQNYDRELARHWQLQTTERLRNFVFLIGPKGDKVPLLRYTPAHGGGREFQFAFPREFDGRPVLTAQDKSLKLEFPHPPIGELGDARVLVEFKVDKMVMQGEVVY